MTQAIGTKKLTDRQRELLGAITVGSDNIARFPKDQVIPDWAALKKVMVALGGTWKKSDGFRFPDDVDADELVHQARTAGVIIDPRAADFFETPDEIADLAVSKLGKLDMYDIVLEPSAGSGRLVRAVLRAQPQANVFAVEALAANVRRLEGLRCFSSDGGVLEGDFLRQTPEGIGEFDAVVMNPPFSKRQDIAHVFHAMSFLRPGGVLAAIMSAGVKFRDDAAARSFRNLVEKNAGSIEPLPDGAFKASGTMVRTVLVRMVRA